MQFLIPALIGALSNWLIRGGGLESIFLNPHRNRSWVLFLIKIKVCNFQDREWVSLRGGRIVNALIYGGYAWSLHGSTMNACLLLLTMLAGSTFPLGLYVAAMLSPDRQWWGVYRMTLRGLIWGGIIATGAAISYFWYMDSRLIPFALYTALGGATQGVVYYGMILAFKNVKPNNTVNHWTTSEMIHGGLMWSVLGFLG